MQVDAVAAQVPPADRLRQQPQPHDVAQVADGAVDAALVGEVGLAGWRRSAPARPARRRRAPTSRRRRSRSREPVAGTPTTADAVSCEPTVVTSGSWSIPSSSRTVGRQRREDLPGRDDVGQQPGGQAQRLDQLRRPAPGAGVDQAGGGGDGLLGDLAAGEPVAQQVRDQQRAGGVLQVGLGRQLVDGVDRDDLQAVDGVEPGRVDLLVDLLDRRLAARVAVGVRVAAQRPVRVEQPVVDAPRVDREPGQPRPARPASRSPARMSW